MLYLIGLGLGNEKDLTLKGLEILKNCRHVYLENYTSIYKGKLHYLEELIENKVHLAGRELIENDFDKILEQAKDKRVAILIMGDVFSATTHIDMITRAKEKGIKTEVIHNASVLTAIGETGLSLYKFGKTTSIPFEREVETPYNVIKENGKMHTLILLDIRPGERTMKFSEAITMLKKIEAKLGEGIFKDRKVVGCAGLGVESMIVYGTIDEIEKIDLSITPQCLIVPGDLHFMEEEYLDGFKIS
jgi:diphthine synthase